MDLTPADDSPDSPANPLVDAREEERRARECPSCEGDGWYMDHSDECYATGYCHCSGVQRQCECSPPAPLVDRDTGDEG